jgi:hypothetical protein
MTEDAPSAAASEAPIPPREPGSVLQKLPLQIIESAGFVAMVTAVLYFMGYSYYAGFFERLSLPPPYPELSTSDYFLQAFSSLTGLLVAALLSIPYRSTLPTTIWQAFWVNSAFIIVPLFLAQNARSDGFLGQGLALILAAVVVVAISASVLKRSIIKLLTWRWGIAGAIAYGFGIFLFFGDYFRLEGDADATRFIEGRLQPSSSVVLLTSNPESPVNGERLLVALMRNGDFYLVRQESPAPITPLVYFVPGSEVRTATMQRAGATMATPAP